MVYKHYLFESALGGSAVITEVIGGERPFVRLNQTWFHPQGGGQKADRGTIAGKAVVNVTHDDGEINHYLLDTDGLYVGQEVLIIVDAEWRDANARLHTGGHLIAALAEEAFPTLRASGGHHWPGEARVEFTGDDLPDPNEVLRVLGSKLDQAVTDDLPVQVLFEDASRSIKIGGHAPVPCGGTHAVSTGRLNGIALTKVKVKGGKLRVSYQV